MLPKEKITAIRLSEKIKKNPAYAKKIGIEIKNKEYRKELTEDKK